MFNCNIKTIDPKLHRYQTAGDWWWDEDGTLQIRVSVLGNEKFEQCLAQHEFVEAILCKAHGIDHKTVDEWDISHPELDEPGDNISAPYHHEHRCAYHTEYRLMYYLDVEQIDYHDAINNSEGDN